MGILGMKPLKLGYFREIKIPNLHSRHDHVERFLAASTKGFTHGFDVRQHMDEALVETEVADSLFDLSIYNEEGAIARHARHHFFIRINFADVPQPCDENTAVGGGDHFRERLRILRRSKNNVERHLAHFVRQRESVAGGFDGPRLIFMFRALHSFRRGPRIDNALHHSVLDQRHTQPPHAFAIEGGASLQRMRNVVPDGDVFAEQLPADAAGGKWAWTE